MKQKISFSTSILVACLLLLVAVQANAQERLPELEIILPVENQVYDPGEVINVAINAEGFTFVNFKGHRELFPGNTDAGHADAWIVPADFKGELNHSDAKKILNDFKPTNLPVPQEHGKYKVVVELVRNTHESFDPPIRKEAIFRVGAPSATAQLVDSSGTSRLLYIYAVPLLLLLLTSVIVRSLFFNKPTPAEEEKQLFNIN